MFAGTRYVRIKCSITTFELSIRSIRPLSDPRGCFGEGKPKCTSSVRRVRDGDYAADLDAKIEYDVATVAAENNRSGVACRLTIPDCED
jgi:hypothetical protein